MSIEFKNKTKGTKRNAITITTKVGMRKQIAEVLNIQIHKTLLKIKHNKENNLVLILYSNKNFLHKNECTRLPAFNKVIPVHDYPRKVSSTRKEIKECLCLMKTH